MSQYQDSGLAYNAVALFEFEQNNYAVVYTGQSRASLFSRSLSKYFSSYIISGMQYVSQ